MKLRLSIIFLCVFIIHHNASWCGSNINHVNGNDNTSELKVDRLYFWNPHMCVSKLKVGVRGASCFNSIWSNERLEMNFPKPIEEMSSILKDTISEIFQQLIVRIA